MYKLLLLIIAISIIPLKSFSFDIGLIWDAPTNYLDGSKITNLLEFKVYYGNKTKNYNTNTNVGNTNIVRFLNLTNHMPYYFAVTAVDKYQIYTNYLYTYTTNMESDFSEELFVPPKTNALSSIPNKPFSLKATSIDLR